MHKPKEKEQHTNAKGPDDNEETGKGNQESHLRPENWVMEDEKCLPDEIYSDQPRSSSNRVSKQTFRSEVDSTQTKEDYKQKLKSFVDKQSETKRSVYPVTEKMEIIITLIAGHLTLIYNKAGLFPEAFDTPYWDASRAEEVLESWKAVTHAMQKAEKQLEGWLEKQNEADKEKGNDYVIFGRFIKKHIHKCTFMY